MEFFYNVTKKRKRSAQMKNFIVYCKKKCLPYCKIPTLNSNYNVGFNEPMAPTERAIEQQIKETKGITE